MTTITEKARRSKTPGRLLTYSAAQLAALAHSESLPETSVGFATINALLDVDVAACVEVNAADVIAERGAGRNVAIVGHFPFIPHLRSIAKTLWVLELRPREDDLPASMAADVLPQADVVALTGTSLLNHTFEELIALCRPDAFVVMLGGTTPLSPVLFEFGVDCGGGDTARRSRRRAACRKPGCDVPADSGEAAADDVQRVDGRP